MTQFVKDWEKRRESASQLQTSTEAEHATFKYLQAVYSYIFANYTLGKLMFLLLFENRVNIRFFIKNVNQKRKAF